MGKVVAAVLVAVLLALVALPVLADTGTLSPSDGIDTMLSSAGASTNYDGQDLGTGRSNANSAYRRSLIKFDLSSIPANAVVSSATLSLYTRTDFATNPSVVNVWRMVRDWSENQATWSVSMTGTSWSSSGVGPSDIDGSVIWGQTTVSATAALNTEVTWSLDPGSVGLMVSGFYPNYGFLLKSQEDQDGWNWYSSENGGTSYKPKLVIVYTVPTATPTHTVVVTLTPTNTNTPVFTNTPTNTAVVAATSTFTPFPSITPSSTLVPVSTSTNTPLPSVTFTPSVTATVTLTPIPNVHIPKEVCIEPTYNPAPGAIFVIFNPLLSIGYWLVGSQSGRCYFLNGSGPSFTVTAGFVFVTFILFYFLRLFFPERQGWLS